MKKYAILCCCILLAACSANLVKEGSAELYHTEYPLELELDLPTKIAPKQVFSVRVLLTRNEVPINELEGVQLKVWKNEQPNRILESNLAYEKEGWYQTDLTLTEDGIYFLQVLASTDQSSILPTKRFIVGELSDEELNQLKQLEEKPDQESHHEHH
ncbi:hypothetical protein [Gracilibacillus dipsosauri]|uniref:hypothetical protein n=1 Tax=Gracilibacillus dipsosauri TaxID=178340 RepID=UPI002408F6AA